MQKSGAGSQFQRTSHQFHYLLRLIYATFLVFLFLLKISNISATSSTSSPPTPLYRLLVPSADDGGDYKNDLEKPCNRSRYHITNSTYGEISDGPDNYTQDTTCEWLIEAPKGHWISLHLDEVETECSYDYLFIFDGNSYQKGQGRLLASFSGNSKPQVTLLAQSGYMLILLFSDPNYTLAGFRAEYSTSACPLNCSNAGECIQIQNEHICKCHESRSGFACQETAYTVTSPFNISYTNDGNFDNDKISLNLTQPPLPPEVNYRHLISANYKSPLARVGHSVVQLENLLYIFGGYDLNDVLDDLWVLDLDNNNTYQIIKSSHDGTDLFWPNGRYGHSSVAYDEGFLIYGGNLRDAGITDELLYFNVKTERWNYIASPALPALAYHSMTKAGKYVYVYGGGTRWGGFSHSLYRFQNPSEWELIVSPCCGKSEERSVLGHSMTYWASKNALVLYGGIGAAEIGRFSKLSNSIYLYLIDSNTWLKIDNRRSGHSGQPFITPDRAFHTAHIVDQYLIILGGYSHIHNKDESCYATFVLVYSIECHVFLPQKAYMKLDKGIFAHQSFVWKDEFVLIGGYRGYLNQKVRKLPLPFSNRTTESCSDYDKWQWQCASDPRCGWCSLSKRCFEKTSGSNCTTNLHTLQCPGICPRLSSCLSCTVPGINCGWCDHLEQCWKMEELKDNCLSKPSISKSQKYEQNQCFDQRQNRGLTQIEYRYPLDLKNPDNVRITNTSVLIVPRDFVGGASTNRQVVSELRGYLESYNVPGKKLEICTYQTEVNVTFSNYEETLNQFYNWTDYHHCYNLTLKSGKVLMLLPDIRLQLTLMAKSFGPDVKQEKSGRVILQDKWPSTSSFRSLKKDNLRPYEKEENCSIHQTCFACLTNAFCAWETAQSKCFKRTALKTRFHTEIMLHPIVLNPEECPICNDKRFCEDCVRRPVGGVDCEWDEVDASCNKRGRHENHTIKSIGECPLECHLRRNCSTCLNSPGCVWCEQQQECFVFSVYTSIYQYGKCYQWADKPEQCSRCGRQLKCEPCVKQMGCGWLYDEQGGLCTEGDFSGPYSLPPAMSIAKGGVGVEVSEMELIDEEQLQDITSKAYSNRTWTYSVCPDVDECALNLHDCNHPNSTCVNTVGSYKCICNQGYSGDGKTCEKTCLHPCKNGVCSPDYICQCNIGWSGVDCSIDCGCHYHSFCENGTCEKCVHFTTGKYCEECLDTTYGNATKEDVGCRPCECNGHGDVSRGICDKNSGTCFCLDNTEGKQCEKCAAGYYGDPRNGQPCYRSCGGRVYLRGSQGYFGFLPETFSVYHKRLLPTIFGILEGEQQAVPVIKHCLWLIEASPEERNDVMDDDEESFADVIHEELIIEIGKDYKIKCSTNGLQVYTNWAGSRYHAPLVATVCADDDTQDIDKNVILKIPGRNAAILLQYAQIGMHKLSFNASFKLHRKRSIPFPDPLIMDSPIKISKLYDGRSVLSRFGHSVHLESKNMWIFGGYSLSHGPLNDIRHYDRESGVWVPLTITVIQSEEAVPSARYFHGGTLTPTSSILIHGGVTSHLTILSDTWKFDTRSSRWTKLCDGPSEGPKLAGHSLTVKPEGDSFIVIMIGGFNSAEGFSDKVYILQGTECWTPVETVGSSPVGIYGHSSVYHAQSDTVYVYGGNLYESHVVKVSQTLFSLHLPTRRWSVLPSSDDNSWPQGMNSPPKRMFHSAVSTNSYMLILGGIGRNASMLAYVYACNSWQVIEQTLGNEELHRIGAASAIHGHQILYMGGLQKGAATESVYQIDVPEDILCSIHNTSKLCKAARFCSVCSSNNDEKEQCYRSELDMPEKCSSGATNIRFWAGKSCASLSFQEQKCDRLRTCEECLAVWPTHPNSSQGCSWCTTTFNLGRCIPASKSCEAENQRGQKPKTITDSTQCSNCSASQCEKCGASGPCIWSRQIIRNAQRKIEVRFAPLYDWSCVPKFILNSTSLNITSSPPRPCSNPCSSHTTCQECLKSAGNEGGFSLCKWSVAFKKCVSPAHIPLLCFGGVCGAILQTDSGICPLDCGVLRSCSSCLQNPLCGWCSAEGRNGEGVCVAAEKVVGEGFSCGAGFNWAYKMCPKENECTNQHHDCDPVSQECIDLDQGFKCQCKAGYERTSGSVCVPICSPACEHGKCVAPNHCDCNFGYVGANCGKKCNCNGHSNCLENDLNNCTNCLNNTHGPHCAKCKAFYVGDPTENVTCISCNDYCNAHSSVCLSRENYNRWCNVSSKTELDLERLRDEIIANGIHSGPTSVAYCCGCNNNTSGSTCSGCVPGHFRSDNDLRLPCEKCECNGHSDTCDPENGLNCQCGNNTVSQDCSQSTTNQNSNVPCWKKQCSDCKEHYWGSPTEGRQCYRQLNVDLENCFIPDTKTCSLDPDPLLAGRTTFFVIQPKFLNVNLRIWLDVTQGAINVYLASHDDVFLVNYDNHSNLHKVDFDEEYRLGGSRNDMGRKSQTSHSQYLNPDEESFNRLDFPPFSNISSEVVSPTRMPIHSIPSTTKSPKVGYFLVQIEAAGFASYHTIDDRKAVLLVKNLRNRLVVTLPQERHDLRSTRFYLVLEGVGDKSFGSIFFRQDQQHIDLFVFFSVFFSSFFIFLSFCGVLYKFKQTIDIRRARQRHVDEMLSMAKRPFAVTTVILEPDPNSHLHEAYTQCRKVCRKGCICLRPIAVEYTTERSGISSNAAVCTMLVSVAGGPAAPVRLCLASVLVSLRPYPTHNIVRRRRIQTQ